MVKNAKRSLKGLTHTHVHTHARTHTHTHTHTHTIERPRKVRYISKTQRNLSFLLEALV